MITFVAGISPKGKMSPKVGSFAPKESIRKVDLTIRYRFTPPHLTKLNIYWAG